MKTLKVKIAISIVASIFALIAIELGLKAAGYLMFKTQTGEYRATDITDESYEIYSKSDKSKKILCIGDSFTNGGNVGIYENYPYNLFKEFKNKSQTDVSVLNLGKCEDNTFGVLRRLEEYFAQTKTSDLPKMALVLVGSSDRFNPEGLLEKGDAVDTWMAPPVLTGMTEKIEPLFHMHPMGAHWWQNLHLYKLYRYIKLGLFHRFTFGSASGQENIDKDIDQLRSVYETYKKAHAFLRQGDQQKYDEFRNTAIQMALQRPQYIPGSKLKLNYIDDNLFMMTVLEHLISLYGRKMRYDDLYGLLLDALDAIPLTTFDYKDDYYFRYYLIQMFPLQSKYEASDVKKVLDSSVLKFPELKNSEYLKAYYPVFENWNRAGEEVEEQRLSALRKIVSLCRQYHVVPVLLTYPADYAGANNLIRKVAIQEKVNLIDLNVVFDGLIKKDGREKYIHDDDHCTPEGYRIMAEVIHGQIHPMIRGEK